VAQRNNAMRDVTEKVLKLITYSQELDLDLKTEEDRFKRLQLLNSLSVTGISELSKLSKARLSPCQHKAISVKWKKGTEEKQRAIDGEIEILGVFTDNCNLSH
jgi:hypothetical protein